MLRLSEKFIKDEGEGKQTLSNYYAISKIAEALQQKRSVISLDVVARNQ